MQEAGRTAAPTHAVTGFLLGTVLAFQGVTSLRQFRAKAFVVDLIAISILNARGAAERHHRGRAVRPGV
ncbi:MAG: ABC transporter permease [Rhodobacteraceae bacterium]|nr:ABC transporter permease [Paracoccaceae bacterium]